MVSVPLYLLCIKTVNLPIRYNRCAMCNGYTAEGYSNDQIECINYIINKSTIKRVLNTIYIYLSSIGTSINYMPRYLHTNRRPIIKRNFYKTHQW